VIRSKRFRVCAYAAFCAAYTLEVLWGDGWTVRAPLVACWALMAIVGVGVVLLT